MNRALGVLTITVAIIVPLVCAPLTQAATPHGRATGTLMVTITSATTGQPISDASAFAYDKKGNPTPVNSAENGVYEADLSSGRYFGYVTDDHYYPQAMLAALTNEGGKHFTITAGKTTTVEVEMQPDTKPYLATGLLTDSVSHPPDAMSYTEMDFDYGFKLDVSFPPKHKADWLNWNITDAHGTVIDHDRDRVTAKTSYEATLPSGGGEMYYGCNDFVVDTTHAQHRYDITTLHYRAWLTSEPNEAKTGSVRTDFSKCHGSHLQIYEHDHRAFPREPIDLTVNVLSRLTSASHVSPGGSITLRFARGGKRTVSHGPKSVYTDINIKKDLHNGRNPITVSFTPRSSSVTPPTPLHINYQYHSKR